MFERSLLPFLLSHSPSLLSPSAMSEVERVFDACAAEPTQLDIDCDVFKAWTQGVKGQWTDREGRQHDGRKMGWAHADRVLSLWLPAHVQCPSWWRR